MNEKVTIYHGSKDVIEAPEHGRGKKHNDYGLGFYCTENLELAKEWSCASEDDGFVNSYQLNLKELSVLHLNDGSFHILSWLAILLENRTFRIASPAAEQAKSYILETFMPEYKVFDVIKGYRADDSYFAFAAAFLNNGISMSQLSRVMRLGELGEQIVLRSPKAFAQIEFCGAERVNGNLYYPKRIERDRTARTAFQKERSFAQASDEVYMLDILRERWKNDDPRLQRIVY